MSIYNTAVNKPISTLMVFLAIIVLGVASYIQLPVDQYPKMDPPYITVMATYPGANAADIEENVTKILEDQLNSVDDLKELTSVHPRHSQNRVFDALRCFAALFAHKMALPSYPSAFRFSCKHGI